MGSPEADGPGNYSMVKNKVQLYRDRSGVVHPGLSSYFSKRVFSDITVVAPDGRKIPCHQVVLSAGSKRFAKILEQGALQGESELPVWGVDSAALESVLKLFYTGDCHITFNSVVPVYDAAQRLEVHGLASCCERYIKDVLTPGTACSLLTQATNFKMDDLVVQILSFIKHRFDEVIQHEDFLTTNFSMLMKIITYNKPAQPELLLFKAAWSWLVADTSHSKHLDDIIKVVKVPDNITPQELLKLSTSNAKQVGLSTANLDADEQALLQQIDMKQDGGGMDSSAINIVSPQILQQAMLQGVPFPMMVSLPSTVPGGSPGRVDSDLNNLKHMLPLQGNNNLQGNTWQITPELLAQLQLSGLSQLVGQGGNSGGRDGSARKRLSSDDGLDMHLKRASQGFNRRASSPGSPQGMDDDVLPRPSNGRKSGGNKPMGMRGMCQVEGCQEDLAGLRDYHQRYKICEYHLKIGSVMRDGKPQRFCQQCGRFQNLNEFDGNKRSCRARLQRHNDRRRKRLEDDVQPQYVPKKIRELAPDDKVDFPNVGLPAGTTNLRVGGGSGVGGTNSLHMAAIANSAGILSAIPGLGALTTGTTGSGSGSWGLHMLADLANQDNSQGRPRRPDGGIESAAEGTSTHDEGGDGLDETEGSGPSNVSPQNGLGQHHMGGMGEADHSERTAGDEGTTGVKLEDGAGSGDGQA